MTRQAAHLPYGLRQTPNRGPQQEAPSAAGTVEPHSRRSREVEDGTGFFPRERRRGLPATVRCPPAVGAGTPITSAPVGSGPAIGFDGTEATAAIVGSPVTPGSAGRGRQWVLGLRLRLGIDRQDEPAPFDESSLSSSPFGHATSWPVD